MNQDADQAYSTAQLFDVSVDYLLVADAPRRPFRQADDALGQRLVELSDADHAALDNIG